jgi:hypothetical protein
VARHLEELFRGLRIIQVSNVRRRRTKQKSARNYIHVRCFEHKLMRTYVIAMKSTFVVYAKVRVKTQ